MCVYIARTIKQRILNDNKLYVFILCTQNYFYKKTRNYVCCSKKVSCKQGFYIYITNNNNMFESVCI